MPPLRSLKSTPPKKVRHWYEYATVLAYLTVLVLLGAGGVFLLKPRYDAILDLQSRIVGSQQEQQQRQQALINTHRLIDNASKVSSQDRARLDYMLPSSSDLPGLFVQVEALTKASGLTVRSIHAEETGHPLPAVPGAVALPFDINYETATTDPYRDFKQSLDAFEQNLRLFDIQNFSFEVKNSGSAQPGTPSEKRTMQMKFFTYYFPQK